MRSLTQVPTQRPNHTGFISKPGDILLTGATGFVGAWLLWEYLQHTDAHLHCLVRAATPEQGQRRLEKTLSYYRPDADLGPYSHRIHPILGDLGRPHLGLTPGQFDHLAHTIDFICHCGGNVASGNEAALTAANQDGTKTMIELARRHRSKPFHFISTVAISGNRHPNPSDHFHENALDVGQEFHGYRADYAQSKFLSEKLVQALGAQGHPIRIYRLGQVVGDSVTGRFKREIFTDNFYRYLKMMIDFQIYLAVHKHRDRSINIIPVDIAARQIVHISLKEQVQGDTFHLVNPQPISLNQTVATLQRFAAGPMQEKPFLSFFDTMIREVEVSDRAFYKTLRDVIVRDLDRFRTADKSGDLITLNLQYDTTHTRAATVDMSQECPSSQDLLEQLMDYCLRVGFMRNHRAEKTNAQTAHKPRAQVGPLDIDHSRHKDYEHFSRPKLAAILDSVKLAPIYEYAQGHTLRYRDTNGKMQEVLDYSGAFGSMMTGHNHPELVALAQEYFSRKMPMFMPASNRHLAGRFAAQLRQWMLRETGEDFYINFANTGTEAIELTMKHAEMCLASDLLDRFDDIEDHMKELEKAHEAGDFLLPKDIAYGITDLQDANMEVRDFEELRFYISRFNADEMAKIPGVIALKKSFHGKTIAAVQTTYRPAFREAFSRLALPACFVEMHDLSQLERALEKHRCSFYSLVLEGGKLKLRREYFTNVICALIEPVQGEGGIHTFPTPVFQAYCNMLRQHDVPIVFDEIQCGMGRTGQFLAANKHKVVGDYYVWAKSLAGGICKNAAVAIARERYEPDFGLVHTSTFAEDEFSSAVGLKVLELLDRDNGAMMHHAKDVGDYFLQKLRDLKKRWPLLIEDVRGEGLLLALEIREMDDHPSAIMQILNNKDLLVLVMSGWLLNCRNLRMIPVVKTNIFRFTPPGTLDRSAVDRGIAALDTLMTMLDGGDAYALLSYLTDRPDQPELTAYANYTAQIRAGHTTRDDREEIEEELFGIDPSLKRFSYNEMMTLLTRFRILETLDEDD